MKLKSLIVVLLGLMLANSRLPAQVLSGDSEKKARELLREAVNKREVPTPAPIITANSAPLPPAGPNLAPTGLKSSGPINYAEIEQAYLSGKITARQFQRYLENGRQEPAPIISSHNQAMAARQEIRPSNAPIIMKAAQSAPATAVEPAATPKAEVKSEEPAAQPSALSDVEKKMDELLRLKAAREQAAMANSAALSTNNVQENAAPKSKRERLDELLKLYINGKISETEYKEKRGKLITE